MSRKIRWEGNMDQALERAGSEGKSVLIFFHDPARVGCRQMDTVTYPDEKVVNFIRKNIVPLKLPYDAKPMADDYHVKWTPTFIMVNGEGKEHYRMVGFLPPDEMIPSILLGIGKVHFNTERIDEALKYFDNIVDEYPRSDSTAEAIYRKGVCHYKRMHDAKHLKMAYERLQAEYPMSVWTKRAYPYRLF